MERTSKWSIKQRGEEKEKEGVMPGGKDIYVLKSMGGENEKIL